MSRDGSSWRKWDLHLHAPTSAMNNNFVGVDDDAKWQGYITALEGIGEYGAIGITDYMSIDGFLRVQEFRSQERLKNIGIVFPNIEFRILPVTSHEKAINIHVVACPTIAEDLNELLLGSLRLSYDGNPYHCTREGLVNLGRAHTKNSTMPEGQAYRIGIEQFKIDYSQIMDCFNRSRKLRQNALIAITNGSNDGNSGIQESGMAAIRTELYRQSDIILSGNPNDRKYFLGLGVDSPETILEKYGSLKPCVHGSDAHGLGKIGKPDADRHTWVKADPSFEGLRQILFEPDTRVAIGPSTPPTPIHRLRSVKLQLPDDTVMRWDSSDQPFCLRGQHDLCFAAGLTCIIGGRGSGKSTLINLLHERLAPGKNRFWQDHQLRTAGGDVLSFASSIVVDFAGDATSVEFIRQNEVEAFALEPERLTAAIYTRLLSLDTSGKLDEGIRSATQALKGAEAHIALLQRRHTLREQEADLKGRIQGCDHLLSSFSEAEYTETSSELQQAVRELDELSSSRRGLAELATTIERLIIGDTEANHLDVANPYNEARGRLREAILAAVASARGGTDLQNPGAREVALSDDVTRLRTTIELFLTNRGLSQENMTDVAEASLQKAVLEQQLKQCRQELSQCEVAITDYVDPTPTRKTVEEELTRLLDIINTRFSTGASEGRRIELKYQFDNQKAEDALIEQLLASVSQVMPTTRMRSDHAQQILQKAGSPLVTDEQDLIKALREDTSKTGQQLDLYFGKPPHLDVWRAKRKAIAADVIQFMRLEVLYDGKPLDRSSFGQRCSAVLVVLLSLGNGPIVVDEPEAHLDSAVIANFMVDLVKKVKTHRQIIFATHNANFVVNGDAELVHVLVPDDEAKTRVQPTTIEDTQSRSLILALEGGEKAFRMREGRYGLDL